MSLNVNILVFLIYFVAVFVIYHSYKHRGAYKTLLFLFGAIILTAGIENIQVIFGGYAYPDGGLTLMLYLCPLWVPLGWYVILYCSNFVAHIIIGKGKGSLHSVGIGKVAENGINKEFLKLTIIRAAFSAYTSILIDLIMDPVGVANGWWSWKVDNIYIHNIPVGNYIGWFLVIFWMLLFYEIIITWASVKEKKELVTSGIWAGASVVAMFLAGIILMGFTFLFGLEGIRTEDPIIERTYVMDLILQVNWGELMIAGVVVLISIALVLATSLIPNKTPESKPATNFWRVLPSFLMLVFWAVIWVVAFFTSSLMVTIGVLNCIPLFFIHIYVIKNPGLE
jgi:uncharacterized membrane protein